MKKDGRFTAGASGLKKVSGVLVFGLLLAAAGCVQPSDGSIPVDPSLYERLVTVRIPVNTAARALTLELARDAIDFCEVVFKHLDGRIFSASATANLELSIVLPVGTYESVLLAGIYNSNTLLASAYKKSVPVEPDTLRITYELKALNTSVSNVEIVWTGYNFNFSLDGTTSEGFPYFSSLPEHSTFTAAITIGNFPDTAIFDPVLKADSENEDFQDAIDRIAGYAGGDILRVLAPFEAGLATIVAWGEYLEDDGISLTARETEVLTELCDDLDADSLLDRFGEILDPDEKNLQGAITTAKGGNYGSAAAVKAWEAADLLVGALEYSKNEAPSNYWDNLKAGIARYKDLFTAGSSSSPAGANALAAAKTLMAQGPEYPSVAELQAAFAAIKAANTATSGLSAGTLPGAVEDARSVTLPFAGGWVDLDGESSHGTVNVVFTTPKETGFAKLYFDFAFKAFGGSQVHTWHIKQGLDDYAVDDGKGRGGSILLSVVPPSGNP